MEYLTDKKLREIRGKTLVGKATMDEVLSVFAHLDSIEDKLEELSQEDFFGTEGWRHMFGMPE